MNPVARLALPAVLLVAAALAPRGLTAVSGPLRFVGGGTLRGRERQARPRPPSWLDLNHLRTRGDFTLDEAEKQELDGIYAATLDALMAIGPGPEAGAQKRAVQLEWAREMEKFLDTHPASSWAPGIANALAGVSRQRLSYRKAAELYGRSWGMTRDSSDARTRELAIEAGRGLAEMLVMTGQLEQYRTLRSEGLATLGNDVLKQWWWAGEFYGWVSSHPQEAYKCGLACLDQLGRLTEPGVAQTANIFYRASSAEGYDAAALVQIAGDVGLSVRAVMLEDLGVLPVPSVAHLGIEHFVILRQRDGQFYEVVDPVQVDARWLTAAELAEELTGCLLLDKNTDMSGVGVFRVLGAAEAAQFRGRCYHGNAIDRNDGCPEESNPNGCPTCANGSGTGGAPGHKTQSDGADGKARGSIGGGGGGSRPGFSSCSNGNCSHYMDAPGMPGWHISEPYLNLWFTDTPLAYRPSYGPEVRLTLRFHTRQNTQSPSSLYHSGTILGDGLDDYWSRAWTCSWLSRLSYDSASGNQATVRLPDQSTYTFNFPPGSSTSSLLYFGSLWLEKRYSGSTLTGFWLHFANGSQLEYMTEPETDIFYLTSERDGQGNATTFTYVYGTFLSRVTAADGVYFDVQHADVLDGTQGSYSAMTGVTSSYGATVTLGYADWSQAPGGSWGGSSLTKITDVAGIASYVYTDVVGAQRLVTPYGIHDFDVAGWADPDPAFPDIIDRYVNVVFPDQSSELHAMMTKYTGVDWPNWNSGQIPNTAAAPVSTLDTTERQGRNTFYWNSLQRTVMTKDPVNDTFSWADFKQGRIRHWLVTTIDGYAHWGTLSWEQAASPDGGTTEGAVTWYDYAGKPPGSNFEQGTSPKPSVIAQVMPDGNTAWTYRALNSLGNITGTIERWGPNASPLYRTTTNFYSADGLDLVEHRGPDGTRETGYGYGGSHPHLPTSITNALGEVTLYTYDASHRVATVQTPANLLSTYTYGTNGLQKVVDSVYGGSPIRTNQFTWLNGDLRTNIDERNLTNIYSYDALHRLTRVDYPDGSYVEHRYTNGAGLKLLDRTYTRDRMGNETRIEYTPLRQVKKAIDARGNATAYGYCTCGSLEYVTNALNQVTHYAYDYQGRRTSTFYADGTTSSQAYDLIGRPTVWSDALGSVTNFYDNLSRLVAVSNYFGRVLVQAYDVEDQLTNQTDAAGVAIATSYDGLHRPLTRTYPDTGVERFLYAAKGLVGYTNQLSKITRYDYDVLGRKTAETNANLEVIRYTYNPAGDLKTLTDGKSQVTTWDYDAEGRVVSKKYQGQTFANLAYNYDANGRLTWRRMHTTASLYAQTTYGYDNVGNLTSIDYPTMQDVTMQYDALNRRTNVVDASGTTRYTYTSAGQLLTEDGPWANDTVTYSYHGSVPGMRTGLTLQQPAGSWAVTETPDASKRLASVASPAGTFTYGYRVAANVWTNLALPNSVRITNVYDGVGRLTGTSLRKSNGTLVNQHLYQYDTGGRRTRHTLLDGTYTTFGYDNISQLASAQRFTSGGSPIAGEQLGYAYDAGWNLSQRSVDGTPTAYTVNVRNQLTGDGTSNYASDVHGNLVSECWNLGSLSYTYDDENQLVALATDSSTTPEASRWKSEWIYDSRGRARLRKDYTWTTGAAGTEVAKGGMTASASSTTTGWVPAQAINSTTTDPGWHNNTYTGLSEYLGVDLGTTRTISRVAYTPRVMAASYAGGTWNGVYRQYAIYVTASNSSNPDDWGAPVAIGEWCWPSLQQRRDVSFSPKSGRYVYFRRITGWGWYGPQDPAYDGNPGYASANEIWVYENGTGGWTLAAETRYIYDPAGAGRVIQERNSSNVPTVSYTRGLDLSGSLEGAGGIGGLLARSQGYQSGNGTWTTHHCYHADGGGNVTYLIDSAQNAAATYRYDPYGRTLASSGGYAAANTYRFSSKEIHPNSGMYYYGYRFYEPTLQRWVNRDPMGEPGFELRRGRRAISLEGEPNASFTFVQNAPTRFVDSDGLDAIATPFPIRLPFPIEAPPIPIPAWAPPVLAGAAGGAIGWGIGTGLCRAFPNVMTWPGKVIGNALNPPIRTKTCTYSCTDGSAGAGRVVTITVPTTHPCNSPIRTASGATCWLIGTGPVWN